MTDPCPEKKDHFDGGSWGVGFALGLFVSFLVFVFTVADDPHDLKREAVDAGAAEWYIEDHEREFRWVPCEHRHTETPAPRPEPHPLSSGGNRNAG